MGLTPKLNSSLHRQGLTYIQFYNSAKEIFDLAGKTIPFESSALDQLALDPDITASLRYVGGGHTHSRPALEAAYLASKRRCSTRLTNSRQISFGIRSEFRVSYALGVQLDIYLANQPHTDATLATVDVPYRRLQVSDFISYTETTINKYTTGFEYIYSTSYSKSISSKHTDVLVLLLRLLRSALSVQPPERYNQIWKDEYLCKTTNTPLRGLGLGKRIEIYGHG